MSPSDQRDPWDVTTTHCPPTARLVSCRELVTGRISCDRPDTKVSRPGHSSDPRDAERKTILDGGLRTDTRTLGFWRYVQYSRNTVR